MAYVPQKGQLVTANAGGTDFTVKIYGNQAPELPERWAGNYSTVTPLGDTLWHSVLGGVFLREVGRKRIPMMDVHFIHTFESEAEALSDCQRMCSEVGDTAQAN
jgi:hypothetical protein